MPNPFYYPATYQPMYNQNPYMQQMQQIPQQKQMQPIQNGELVFVQSEDEARNYPVAPGNSVTFKNVNEPFFYTKTMGFSQLDKPEFRRYRVMEDEPPESPKNGPNPGDNEQKVDMSLYATKGDLEALREEFADIYKQIKEKGDATNE